MNACAPRVLKIVLYNLLIFFVLANVVYWSIPVVGLLSEIIKGQHSATTIEYRSFIGWRHLAGNFTGGRIIGGQYPQRATINSHATGDRRAYFFGGSVMWGFGVSDPETIPSLFAVASRIHSENYAEIGYTSHQSLILLLQLLQAGHRPDLVIFYDGANEVTAKCQRGLTPESHGQEAEIKSVLRGRDFPGSFTYYLLPVIRFVERIRRESSKAFGESKYDCDSDRAKAQAVSDNLIHDWQFASLLAESFGASFIGILQPVIFFSQTRRDHLNLPPNLDRQYQAVYPSIREKIAGHEEFYDFTSVLDLDEKVFTDFAHTTQNGNKYVAEKILEIAAAMKRRR
jgi:hypothetical protein